MDYDKLDERLFEGQTAHVYLVRLPTITKVVISDTPMSDSRLDDYRAKKIPVISAPKLSHETLAEVVKRLEHGLRTYAPTIPRKLARVARP